MHHQKHAVQTPQTSPHHLCFCLRSIKGLEDAVDILTSQYEACEAVKVEVTGLTDKRLDANQKDLWGTKARYQWQLFPNSYLLHIPIRIVRLVNKIDKQMKDTTVTFLDRKKTQH